MTTEARVSAEFELSVGSQDRQGARAPAGEEPSAVDLTCASAWACAHAGCPGGTECSEGACPVDLLDRAGPDEEALGNVHLDEMSLEDIEQVLAEQKRDRSVPDVDALMRALGDSAGVPPPSWQAWTEPGTPAPEPAYSTDGDPESSVLAEAFEMLQRIEPAVESTEEAVIELREMVEQLTSRVEQLAAQEKRLDERLGRIEALLERLVEGSPRT